jgi:hypothetical protein
MRTLESSLGCGGWCDNNDKYFYFYTDLNQGGIRYL